MMFLDWDGRWYIRKGSRLRLLTGGGTKEVLGSLESPLDLGLGTNSTLF